MKKFLLLSLLAILFGTKPAMADDYVPLVREGVEWGYAYENPGTHYGELTYYRLQFIGTTEFGGKTYHNLHKYYHYTHLGGSEIVAYMREENKKVYIYTGEASEHNAGEELLFDFGIKDDEHFETAYGVKACSETGYVDTANGKRRYMKFDCAYPFEYDMLIEGIGPCNSSSENYLYGGSIMKPWFALTACHPTCDIFDILLYQREVPEAPDYAQAKMIWTNPSSYETIGKHDPSVWQYHRAESGSGGVESTLAAGTDVEIAVEGNAVNVSSASTDILYVETFDLEGRMLTTVKPVNNRCQIPLSTISGVAVVKVTTTTGSYSTKVASK